MLFVERLAQYSRRMSDRVNSRSACDFVALEHDTDHSAVGQRSEQHHLGQRLLDHALDETRHRTRAERTVEAVGREPRRGPPARARWSRLSPRRASRSSSICLSTTRSISTRAERIEVNDGVEAIAELRRKRRARARRARNCQHRSRRSRGGDRTDRGRRRSSS